MSLDLLPFVGAAVSQGDYFHIQSAFDPQTLFSAVPGLAANFRKYFDLLAFVVVSSTVGNRVIRHQADVMMAWVPGLIYALFIVLVPFGLNAIDGAVLDLVHQTGMTDPNAIFYTMTALSDPFEPNDAGEQRNVQQLQADANNATAFTSDMQKQGQHWGVDFSALSNFWKVLSGNAQQTGQDIKASLDFAKDPLGTVGNSIRYVAFKVLSIIGAFLIWVILQCCGIVMYVFLSVRFLLVHLESIVLPVFIAMIATDSLRSAGNNFVLGIVGIMFWPLGWALGHIGTLGIANWFNSMLATTLHVPGTPAPGAIYDMIVNGPQLGLPVPSPQALLVAVGITLLGSLIIGIYVLAVTFSAPFIIAKALKSGSGIYGEMIGGTAKGVAALGAAAAGLAAIAMAGGATAGTVGAQAAAKGTTGGSSGMPVGANAPLALENGAFNQAVGSGGGSSSRVGPLANRATSKMPPGSGGLYAASSDGSAAFIPMSQSEMSSLVSGGGANGGGDSGSSNGGGGGSGSGGTGGKKVAKVTGSSARAYRAVMAMGALQGALEAASQWDGGADVVSHTASRASSAATNQYDRARRLDRQDFDEKQTDGEKA